jgi:hypothetical protein
MSGRASGYVKGLVVCPNGELLSRSEKLVAMVLADSHQDRGRGTFPSVKTMAEEALMDERQCRRLLDSLERKGVIVSKRPAQQGRGQMTYYFFPELDSEEIARRLPQKKEGVAAPLFFSERGAEGGRKGGKSRTPPIEEREQEQKQIHPPTPARGGVRNVLTFATPGDADETLDQATDRVMLAFGLTRRRDRRRLRAQLDALAARGEPVGEAATGMIAEARKTPEERRRELDEANERDGFRMWSGMNDAYKAQNPWRGRVFEEKTG